MPEAGLKLTADFVSFAITQLVNSLEILPPRYRLPLLRLVFHMRLLGLRLAQFLGIELEERVVEYPFVLKNLGMERMTLLDVGCCESQLVAELVAARHDVYGIDLKIYTPKFHELKFLLVDARKMPFINEFFDVVIVVSTLEHIGLSDNGDVYAVKEILRVLKPGGKFILTVPFGNRYQLTWQRFYDKPRLDHLISCFIREEEKYYVRHGSFWYEVARPDAELGPSKVTNSICCLVLRKPENKR